MGVTDKALQSFTLPTFVQSLVMAVGSLSLQICDLDGPFDLRIAAQLLPQTLQHLTLRPDPERLESLFSMAGFERFPQLQHLQIDLGTPAGAADEIKLEGFFLNYGMLFPSLRSLCLSPIHLRCLDGVAPEHCMPCLQHLIVHSDFDRAQLLLEMPGLKCLNLTMSQPLFPRHIYLTVLACSALLKLTLVGPQDPDAQIALSVYKTGIDMSLKNITNVYTYVHPFHQV